MQSVPENTTVEEYTHQLAMYLGDMPEGEIRDEMAAHFAAFRAQIDFLETCFEINPYERLQEIQGTGSPE